MNPHNSSGFSLLEVLISLFLLSITLLGLDAMEITALRHDRESYFFSVATIQLQNMSERLHALNNAQGLAQQISIWNNQNKNALPEGRGIVTGEFPNYMLEIFWGEFSVQHCAENHAGQSGCLVEKILL